MPIIQSSSKRKPSGGRYKAKAMQRKKANLGRTPAYTKLGERTTRNVKVLGKQVKTVQLFADTISIFNPKTKKHEKAKIKTILESPANSQFVRRNIMTKGTIVETEKGKARITSRPGQQGSLIGILI